jgi:spore maturation protein CgeB
MCGAFYMPQYNRELYDHYNCDEICMWRDVPSLVTNIRYYLAYPEDAEANRHNAAIRARRDHTWRRRFEAAFAAMGLTWGEA